MEKAKNPSSKARKVKLTTTALHHIEEITNYIAFIILHLGRIANAIMVRCSYTEHLSLLSFANSISRSINCNPGMLFTSEIKFSKPLNASAGILSAFGSVKKFRQNQSPIEKLYAFPGGSFIRLCRMKY